MKNAIFLVKKSDHEPNLDLDSTHKWFSKTHLSHGVAVRNTSEKDCSSMKLKLLNIIAKFQIGETGQPEQEDGVHRRTLSQPPCMETQHCT